MHRGHLLVEYFSLDNRTRLEGVRLKIPVLVSIGIGVGGPEQNKHGFILKGNYFKIEDSRAKSMTSAARRILASRAALFVRPSPREAKSYARYGFPSVPQTRARGVI